MSKEQSGNGNGTKAFGAVVAVVAVIAGLYAMIEPMGQRIDFLEGQIVELRIQARQHSEIEGHVGVLSSLATQQAKFAEVETQFAGLREVTEARLAVITSRALRAETLRDTHLVESAGRNAAQWERIKSLEREMYGRSSMEHTKE